ncbi:MAG: glycosyltransferase [Byssovorax sp.]
MTRRPNDPLKVLVFTTVFPSPALPTQGSFTPARLRPLLASCDLRVVSPTAWFRRRGKVPARGAWEGFPVEYPSFFNVPGLFRNQNGAFLFASSVPRVRALRREFDFDLIDAHFAYPDGYAAVLLGKLFDRPVTITLHGTLVMLAAFPDRRPGLSFAVKNATRIIAVSDELRRKAIELGADARRIEVIDNGVDTTRFAVRDRALARRALGLPAEGRMLVSVGHLTRRKGYHRVLDVLPSLVEEMPDLRYVVIGRASLEGDAGPALREQARRLGLEDRVIWAGERSPDEVATWLNASNAYVLSSDFEGCPCSVYEAMASGLPVVASKVGEVARMVPDGMGVLFDDPDDRSALREGLRRALGDSWDSAAIRAYAETRSWDVGAKRIEEQWRFALER